MKKVTGSFTIKFLDDLEKDLEKATEEIEELKSILKKQKKVEYSVEVIDFPKTEIKFDKGIDENLMKQLQKTTRILKKILNR